MNMTTLRDFLSALPAPVHRSKTKRDVAAQDARRHLQYYRSSLRYGLEQPTRVQHLLWAEAFIQTALYHETQGRLGHNFQSPAGVVGQQVRHRIGSTEEEDDDDAESGTQEVLT